MTSYCWGVSQKLKAAGEDNVRRMNSKPERLYTTTVFMEHNYAKPQTDNAERNGSELFDLERAIERKLLRFRETKNSVLRRRARGMQRYAKYVRRTSVWLINAPPMK